MSIDETLGPPWGICIDWVGPADLRKEGSHRESTSGRESLTQQLRGGVEPLGDVTASTACPSIAGTKH